tara:strand:+ start:149 stop:850 length:702 start_codon:yes stop_codon:yes gene_type:complete
MTSSKSSKRKEAGVAYSLPAGASPLAKSIGKAVLYIMEGRDIDRWAVASQTGISKTRVRLILEGRYVPTQKEAVRLCNWAWHGFDYSKVNFKNEVTSSVGWKKLNITLPPDLDKRLVRAAYRLNISLSAFVHLAVERLLDQEPVLNTLDKAAELITKARMVSILEQAPEIGHLLAGDWELAVEVGAKLVDVTELAPDKTAAEKFVSPEPWDKPNEDKAWAEDMPYDREGWQIV